MYAIEKGVSMNPNKIRVGRQAKYPFAQMGISESFVVAATAFESKPSPGGTTPRVAASAYAYGRRTGRQFGYRIDETGNVRIWRTK